MTDIENIINAVTTVIVSNSDYSTRRALESSVILQNDGTYMPKGIVFGDDQLVIKEPTLFNKWIVTNLSLLAHNKHILRSDDIISRKYDSLAYKCVDVIHDLASVTLVTMVPDVTRLSKPIYAFDFQPDEQFVMSPAEFNAYQMQLARQAKDESKSLFSNLKPLEFKTTSLANLGSVFVNGTRKVLNTSEKDDFQILVMHVNFDTDPDYLDDAINISVKEAILSYGA